MKYALIFAAALWAAGPPNEAAADFALGRWEALYARFGPQMKAAVSMEKLKDLAALGPCRVPADPPLPGGVTPNYTAWVYRLECEKKPVGLRLSVDAQGLVQGLRLLDPPTPPTGLAVVTGSYSLPAKLTLPEGPGPFAAVVLVHGSGPNDMDETIGPNKPFRDIADGLAARGIASLRYVKRTNQYGASMPANITLNQETIQDALSAVRLLRNTARIDPKRIYIVGHSLGAYAAPRIGQADTDIAGLVLLAGNTRPFDVVLNEQIQYLGGTPAEAQNLRKRLPPEYLRELSEDPVAIAKNLPMPMLILQGERDYQVTMEDFKGWRTLEGPRVTLKSYPALNHLFQPGQGKSKPAEYQLIAPFSPVVLDDIAAWIRSQQRP